ncbi:DUF4424 domain-containing protein [Phenylobacterium sp.]|uniref:DUF4424 domain-containing protein n=1 Tax=Phenylobacterium sp. TaxID=1871053 RepID=UPI002F42A5AF
MRARTRALGVGLAALIAAAATDAAANDSSAELATGGLVLTRNPAIEMRSEDLSISTKAVRVHYVFANTSANDVTILVAFPMPDVTIEGLDDNIVVPSESPTNLLGFVTTVDGQPVAAQVEQKALKNGADITAYLNGLGIPLAPHLQSTNDVLDKLPKAAQDALVARSLAIPDDYDVGHGMEHHLSAAWTLKTTFYWRQTFPAGRTIDVEHNYTPSVGGTAGTQWADPAFVGTALYTQGRQRYCIDDAFLAGAAKARTSANGYMTEQRIDYVLTTGANWKAPIGDFHMTIDKGASANLVSFCGNGVARTGPTRFEVHYTNFTPTKDVAILLLVPVAQQ